MHSVILQKKYQTNFVVSVLPNYTLTILFQIILKISTFALTTWCIGKRKLTALRHKNVSNILGDYTLQFSDHLYFENDWYVPNP